GFVQDYKQRRLDAETEASKAQKQLGDPAAQGEEAPKAETKDAGKRRERLREYLRWLRPHRNAVVVVLLLAMAAAGLEMIEPLFMRFIIAVVILLSLNWRLALTALAIIPGVMLVSLTVARRVRPIYRSVRKDAEEIDGRVGETFSGIRVVRAFRREVAELLNYVRGRHTVLRKELFAHRRELILWTSWGLLLSGVNVVIVWYGGYLNIAGRASIGDIMAFQWYTFLLLNPVWQIVNSFS